MSKQKPRARVLILAIAIAGSMVAASAAVAGECPADKMKANTREKVDYKPVGVSDVTLPSISASSPPISRAANCASASSPSSPAASCPGIAMTTGLR